MSPSKFSGNQVIEPVVPTSAGGRTKVLTRLTGCFGSPEVNSESRARSSKSSRLNGGRSRPAHLGSTFYRCLESPAIKDDDAR